MNNKIICRKTRQPNELCATENQHCKRCGALTGQGDLQRAAIKRVSDAPGTWMLQESERIILTRPSQTLTDVLRQQQKS